MSSHMNIDWEGTRDANHREYNTNARWNLKYQPNSNISQKVYSRLGGADHGIGGKYEGDPLVSPSMALRKELHRKQVGVDALTRARASSACDASSPSKASMNNLPTIASPTRYTPEPRVDYANGEVSDAVAGGSTANINSTTGTITTNATTTSSSRAHCHRKHKKNCPKHLLNELRRRKEAEDNGTPAPYSEVLDGPDAVPDTRGMTKRELYNTDTNVDKLVKKTPFLVGRSMAYVFTGSYDPKVNVREHRIYDEHPDFTKAAAKVARMEQRYASQPGGGRWEGESPHKHRTEAGGSMHNNTPMRGTSMGMHCAGGTRNSNALTDGTNDISVLNTSGATPFPARRGKLVDTSHGSNGSYANFSGRFSATDNDPITNASALIAGNRRELPSRENGPHRHLGHVKVVPEALLADPHTPDSFHGRKKYEMKSHMEAMRSMGNGLLREFAGGKGFK